MQADTNHSACVAALHRTSHPPQQKSTAAPLHGGGGQRRRRTDAPHHTAGCGPRPCSAPAAFLCNFLDGIGIKSKKVLRAATFAVSLFNLAQSADSTSEFYSICFLWEAYRDCFYNFSFSLRFFLEVSHVEGSSLTTSPRYQTSAFYEISKPKVD